MNILPKIPSIGNLKIEEIFEYYDFPRVFTCKNSAGLYYFVISTYDDDERLDWLYLPISSYRKQAIYSKKISLKSAFKQPEDGYLIKVTNFFQSIQEPIINYILPEQLTDDDLPLEDYLINFTGNNITLPYEQPSTVAVATRRETFDYHIFPNTNTHDIPARKLGTIMVFTQELVDALGQATLGTPTVRGPLPADLLQKTKMDISSRFFPSSFGVQFSASQTSDLFNQSTIQSALREFSELLKAADSEKLLIEKLHELKGRVASKYLKLLKELVDLNSGILLEWGSVNISLNGSFHLSPQQVKKASEIVGRIEVDMAEEMTIAGQVIGFNIRTNRFEIKTNNNERFIGYVAEDATLIPNPTVGNFYTARIRSLIKTQYSSGDEVVHWELISLSPIKT